MTTAHVTRAPCGACFAVLGEEVLVAAGEAGVGSGPHLPCHTPTLSTLHGASAAVKAKAYFPHKALVLSACNGGGGRGGQGCCHQLVAPAQQGPCRRHSPIWKSYTASPPPPAPGSVWLSSLGLRPSFCRLWCSSQSSGGGGGQHQLPFP